MKRIHGSFLVFALMVVLSPATFLASAEKKGDHQFPQVRPESMGFTRKGLERVKTHMQRYVDEKKLAGLLTLVARNGKILHFEKYGMRNIARKQPMQGNEIFRLASMTKPVTSVALMMLCEQGLVNLQDPISQFIPAFAGTKVYAGGQLVSLAHPITVQDVLTHTSGITAGWPGNNPVYRLYRESDLDQAVTLRDFVRRLARLPLLHQPGAAWTYGFSTDVAGRIVEVVSGLPLDKYIVSKILHPLEMYDTGFILRSDQKDRLAQLYSFRDGSDLEAVDLPTDSKFARGVSGLFSTPLDYLRFAQMLLNGGELDGVRLLKTETVNLMTRNHLPDDLIPIAVMDFKLTNNGFGLGFSVVVDSEPNGQVDQVHPDFWWHRGAPPTHSFGWVGIYMTDFWIDPDNGVIGMLMTQAADGMRFPFLQEFHTMVYEAFDK